MLEPAHNANDNPALSLPKVACQVLKDNPDFTGDLLVAAKMYDMTGYEDEVMVVGITTEYCWVRQKQVNLIQRYSFMETMKRETLSSLECIRKEAMSVFQSLVQSST